MYRQLNVMGTTICFVPSNYMRLFSIIVCFSPPRHVRLAKSVGCHSHDSGIANYIEYFCNLLSLVPQLHKAIIERYLLKHVHMLKVSIDIFNIVFFIKVTQMFTSYHRMLLLGFYNGPDKLIRAQLQQFRLKLTPVISFAGKDIKYVLFNQYINPKGAVRCQIILNKIARKLRTIFAMRSLSLMSVMRYSAKVKVGVGTSNFCVYCEL